MFTGAGTSIRGPNVSIAANSKVNTKSAVETVYELRWIFRRQSHRSLHTLSCAYSSFPGVLPKMGNPAKKTHYLRQPWLISYSQCRASRFVGTHR
jgi:hypothetical protein